MKTILGAVSVSLLLFAACGGDSGSTGSPSGPEQTDGGAAGADSGNDSTGAGVGGESTDQPLPQGGEGTGDNGGAGVGGELAGGAGGEGSSGLSSITGHIQTFTGAALPGAVVIVNGASTVTDDQGAFTLDAVPASYDATVIFEDAVRNLHVAEVVDGLTTRDLTLRLWQTYQFAGKAAVSGKLTAIAKDREALVQVVGEHVDYRAQSLLAGDSTYAFTDLSWEGGTKAAADIVALEWTPSQDGPTSYDGFARKSIELTNNANLTGTNLTLTKPAQKTVTGTVFVEGNPVLEGYLELGQIRVSLPAAVGPLSVVVPDIGETPVVSVGYQGTTSAWVTAPATMAAPIPLDVPKPPQLILPIDKAKIDKTTEFRFTHDGPIAALWWSLGSWIVVHVTAETRLTLPDLKAAGIDWDAAIAEGGMWGVESHTPSETPEGFLSFLDGTSPVLTHALNTTGRASRVIAVP